MSYRCCPMIQMSALNVLGRIDTGESTLSLCCERVPNRPEVAFARSPEELLRSFVGECALVAAECAHITEDQQRYFTAGCTQCANFLEDKCSADGLIHYVNFSMYPAPCQSHCIYCIVHKDDGVSVNSDAVRAAYEKLFGVLELAERYGIVAPDAVWQVSSGEITIHPYRDRIMKLVRGKRTGFYTNCMKFDEEIAQNLHDNPNSFINLSIDAGTPETWEKVKGVDNFDKVTENLAKYYARSARPDQITLKYIVLPGINDVYEDYQSLMEIMKVLEVKHLSISRDTPKKYSIDQQERAKLTGAAAYLLAMCHKNGISYDMLTYTQEEQKAALRLAKEIFHRGQV